MGQNLQNDAQNVRNHAQNVTSKQMVTDFGTRTIVNQNFSKLVALPKTALANCGEFTQVKVQLVQENSTKYIKLVPITRGGETK